jgi:hypothetical protein
MKMKLAQRAIFIVAGICACIIIVIIYKAITDENSSLYYIMSIDRKIYRSDRTDAFIYASLPSESLIKIIDKNSDWQKYPKDSFAQNLRSGKYVAALAALACKSDKTAIAKVTEILKQNPGEWDALKYIAKSRNVAMTKCLCDILLQLEDVKVSYPNSQTDKILISTLIELDDPSALECFIAIKEKRRFKSELKQIEKAISRWRDIKSGSLDPAYSVPFEYDRAHNSSKDLINVSSFGGYSFNLDRAWAWSMARRDDTGADRYDFSRQHSGLCSCASRLEICVTRIANKDAPPAKDLNEYIQEIKYEMGLYYYDETNPYFIKAIDVNGSPCAVAEVKFIKTRKNFPEEYHYYIFHCMRIGAMEIYGVLYYYDYKESLRMSHNANELIDILKSFKFDTRWRKPLWAK